MSHLDLVTIIVEDYDPAIRFFVDVLGFELAEDSPSTTNDGRPKRWVVVRPPGGQTGLLLARADGPRQTAAVGEQTAGRVGFFLRVDDFAATHARMLAAGVELVTEPRDEPYGRVAVFVDVAGNRWESAGASPRLTAWTREQTPAFSARPDHPERHTRRLRPRVARRPPASRPTARPTRRARHQLRCSRPWRRSAATTSSPPG